MLGLYKKYKVNPFSLFFSLLIQIPIFIALYFTFFHTTLPEIDTSLLYSFVQIPTLIDVNFLEIVDLTKSGNILLALIVAGLQYLVVRYSMGRTNKASTKHLSPEKLAVQKMQYNMMLYVLPGIIAAVSYGLPSAVGLYFAAGSVISIGQEWLIRKQYQEKAEK
jgi:YidC/Oxa1 family membrane protein insertase